MNGSTMNPIPIPEPHCPAPVSPPAAPDALAADERLARIVEHPDGYYWLAFDGHQEFGPFDNVDDALADMDAAPAGDESLEPGETLAEAEQEIGIAEWIDPDTGAPAEATTLRISQD